MRNFLSRSIWRISQYLNSIPVFVRTVIAILIQVGLIALSNLIAFALRFEAQIPHDYWQMMLQGLPLVSAIYIVVFWVFGVEKGLWRYIGFHDLKLIVSASLTSLIVCYLLMHSTLGWYGYPRTVIILTGLLSLVFLVGIRGFTRVLREWTSATQSNAVRILIVGAGSAGEMLARDLTINSRYQYKPVVFVDDNPGKQKRTIHGIPVGGTIADIPALIRRSDVQELVVAIPSASTELIQRILAAASSSGVPIKTLPSTRQILVNSVLMQQVRPMSLEDLLQREPIETDLKELYPLLRGRRIMVTGAGGSIGSELCRQVAHYQPAMLILFERHENSLHALDLELRALYPSVNLRVVVGDVTHEGQVRAMLKTGRPDIIFHAAAYKHVPMMERNVAEAIRNNVFGTKVVAQAACAARVERMVLISSDKAVNPCNVMGATKRLAESIIQLLNKQGPTKFTTVRFGNVLGSAGSVVPLFTEQIKKGGPVTVTHPEIKRYFMTIPESVQLILQATLRGAGGDLFVLDMGEQIRVVDLARNMIMLSGHMLDRDIKITFIGLRPGEKLYEELFEQGEQVEPTSHSKIKRAVCGPSLSATELTRGLDEIADLLAQPDPDLLLLSLKRLVPTFTPATNVSSDRQLTQ